MDIKRPARVLHIIHGVHFGGAEKLVENFAQWADRIGIGVTVVCLADGRLYSRLRGLACQVYLVPMRSKVDLSILPQVIRLIRTHRIDIIHAHSVRTNLLGRLCVLVTGRPVVSTVHAPYSRDTNETLQPKPLNALIDAYMSRLTSCFVTVNRRLAGELLDSGVPHEKVRTIYNGVEVPSLEEHRVGEAERSCNTTAGSAVVGMVAAFRPRKGAEYLLRAIPLVLKRYPDARFLFVGDDEFVRGRDYLGDLRGLASELGVERQTAFVGFRDDVRAMTRSLDLIVLPSLFGEGLPLALLEAMALRKPVVATRTEGNDEVVIDGQTGFLVPPRDPEALATSILTLLGDPAKRTQFGMAGFERVRAYFTIARMLESYRHLYKELLAKRR